MFKLGVFSLEDYTPQPSGAFGKLRWALVRNRISLRLLRTSIPASPRELEVFEALMQSLRLNAGIYRTTFHDRFRELDPFVNRILAARYPADAALEVRDWAASDCLTSSEWAESLLRQFPTARLQASDLTLFLAEISFDSHTLIQERDGQPLQYISDWFVVNVTRPEQRPRILTRRLIDRALAASAQVKARLTIPAAWLDSAEQTLCAPPFTVRKLPMVHPAAVLFQQRNPRFSVSRHSVFDVLRAPVDVIRSMNIYNLSYFDTARLGEGARTVWHSLRPGGVWVVGRTWREAPPAHNVTVFERTEAGFRLLERQGQGSEIEPIALEQRMG